MRASSNEAEPVLPGQDLVNQGLADLLAKRITDHSLLLLIVAPRLRRLGFEIPDAPFPAPPEHELYDHLAARFGNAAHSHYNSLLRRIVSFSRALEREKSSILR